MIKRADDIADKMVGLIKKDQKALNILMRARSFSRPVELTEFLDKRLLPALKRTIKVADYDNIREKLEISQGV